ncbi:hypothetical protein EON65_29390 [archaeon]|nr:MAG: hypothetical protein EON65_29390 [archaeon]
MLLALVFIAFYASICDAYHVRPFPSAVSRLLGLSKTTIPSQTGLTYIYNNGKALSEPNELPTQSEVPKIAEWKKHMPNALTMFRMAAIPLIIISFALKMVG